MSFKFYFKALYLFPSTFLHELAHLLVAYITPAKIVSFNLFPRRVGNRIVFGSVVARYRPGISMSLSAIAPLIWWVVLYYFVQDEKIGLLKQDIYSVKLILKLYIAFLLLWAGKLSTQDIKMFFKGFL